MKNRASSHLLLILMILGLEIMGYIAVHRAGLLRGYETSIIGAVRDLAMFIPLMIVALWLSRAKRFAGNWVLFTTAVLLFGFGMLIQYRLYSDPEYNARNKAAAREEKMEALRTRYIMENYDPVKKQLMGLPPTPAQPIDIDQLPKKESTYSLWNAITSSYTWIHSLVHRLRDRLFDLRARRVSVMATAKQFHHRAVHLCRWRWRSSRPAPVKHSAT